MKRAGIGGVQTFDVDYKTPDIVEQPLNYMSSPWKEAFRYAAREADRIGLELGIATSPGWSETGGPWVQPADGMKKLVWSTTDIASGQRFEGRLAAPPNTTGPFQDIAVSMDEGDNHHAAPQYYADIAVLAFPLVKSASLAVPRMTTGNGTALDAVVLVDGKFANGLELPSAGAADFPLINISYDQQQTVRGLTIYGDGNASLFHGANISAILEVKAPDGTWSKVIQFNLGIVPTTVSFAPINARQFRLRMKPRNNRTPMDWVAAPGYAGFNAGLVEPNRTIQLSELRLLSEAKVNYFEEKAGFAVARDYYALDGSIDHKESGVPPTAIENLTGKLRPDGTLDWVPPEGSWRIIRFGYSLTGTTNHPAPPEATGLEVDKMDRNAVRSYMNHYIETYRETVGAELLGTRGVSALLTDSTEVGPFNWTPGMLDKFRELRGYDPLPWLPTLTGEVIGSREQSDGFLYDFRRTIADLHASEHYGTVAQVAHENGLIVYGEALEGWRVSLGDDIDMRRYTDVPMAAMWAFPRDVGARPLLIADLRTAASSAHLRGKPYIAAESMTSSRFPWAHGPAELRRIVDLEFAHGVNRVVIHTSPHQPVDDKQPGLSMRHIGQFFDRHETWAEMARPWIDYIARSSFLLQQGRFVADVAYFVGEEAPAGALAEDGYFTDTPTQYGYDLINASAITDMLAVDKGDLVSEGGARYRVLYLSGTSEKMTVPVLRKIAQLAEDGATIVGDAPRSTPSLADNPQEFSALVQRLWTGQPVTTIGKGRVIAGKNLDSALRIIGAVPDVVITGKPGSSNANANVVDFVHRQLADGDIYFVRNPRNTPLEVEARFRVSGRAPEIWKADTGTIEPVSFRMEEGRTSLALQFEAEESYFVVFRRLTEKSSMVVAPAELKPIRTLDGVWTVSFSPGRGAPPSVQMSSLAPLNESEDPGIRFFSGVTTYQTSFNLSTFKSTNERKSLALDLGAVGDLAEVWVNGEYVGTVWHAPFQIDIGSYVKKGENALEIRVANLWANRLIGDAQPQAKKIAWTSVPMYRADAPLRPSGLIGPVRLMRSISDGQK